MADIYLLIDGEQKGPYSEGQVKAMYVAGTITSDVHYWTEDQTEWLPVDTLFVQPEQRLTQNEMAALPAVTQKHVEPGYSFSVRGLARTFLVSISVLTLLVVAILFIQGQIRARQAKAFLAQQEAVKLQRQIPLQIKQAINDLSSATSTGVNKETYTNLVIALKSAVSTYGQNLPSDEAKLLSQIVDTYDIGVQLWDRAQTDGDGISIIVLDIAADSDLDTVVKHLGVPTQLVAVYNENDTTHHQYFRTDVLSRLWTLNDAAIKALNDGVDNESVINSFNAQLQQKQTSDVEAKPDVEQSNNAEARPKSESVTDFTISASSKEQMLRPKDYEETVKSLTSKAQQGDADAENTLAVMYRRGLGVPRDFTNALSYFNKAATQNDAEAEFHLGMMYVNGLGVRKDTREGLQWITQSANHNFALAQSKLGTMYRSGKNVAQDYTAAMDWLAKAANQDDSNAQYELGCMYEMGQGTSASTPEAIKWLEKAAANKSVPAAYELGRCYASEGANKDYAKALEWYKQAVTAEGYPKAEDGIGLLYYNGCGVTEDHVTAFTWMLKSANQGFSQAELSVGVAYYKGDGVSKDNSQALTWIESAANHGEKDLETLMSAIYLLQVLDSSQHPEQIVQTKAKNGDSIAQYSLGLMYEAGAGVPKDDKAAVDWFQKSADQGNDDANDKLLVRKNKAGTPLTANEWKIVLAHHASLIKLYDALGAADDSFQEDSHHVNLYYGRALSGDGTKTNDLYVILDLLKTKDGDIQAAPAAFRITGEPTICLY
jgi:TPR repeat protein